MTYGPAYDVPILGHIYRSLLYYLRTHVEKDEAGLAKTLVELFPALVFVRGSQLDPSRPSSETELKQDEPKCSIEHIDALSQREQLYGGAYVQPWIWMLNMFVGGGDAGESMAYKMLVAEEWLLRAFRHGVHIPVYEYTYSTTGNRGKSDDAIGHLRCLNPRAAPQSFVTEAQGGQGWVQLTFEGSIRLFRP